MKFFKFLFLSMALVLSQGHLLFAGQQMPAKYKTKTACEKQDWLWQQIENSKHDRLPKLERFGPGEILKMGFQSMGTKINRYSDVAPDDWEKYLHKRGAVAKVRWESTGDHNYTGIFKGADCGLLRLSLTFDPQAESTLFRSEDAVAPGLALKVLLDASPGLTSVNVSALYLLSGQGSNYNFFENSLSNIVPKGSGAGAGLVHRIFKRASSYPEELKVRHFATYNAQGQRIQQFVTPRQLFFVPNVDLKFSKEAHDFRTDLLSIPSGTVIYKIHAVPLSYAPMRYNYFTSYTTDKVEDFLRNSVEVGSLVTTSKFVASQFGDTRLFFRHEVRSKK